MIRKIILFIYSSFAFLANLYNKVKFLCCQPRCIIYIYAFVYIPHARFLLSLFKCLL